MTTNPLLNILSSIGNYMSSFSKMNNLLFDNWQDNNSVSFKEGYAAPIGQGWKMFAEASQQHGTKIHSIEQQLEDMANELRHDEINASRIDVEF
jgi:hypothetical protein